MISANTKAAMKPPMKLPSPPSTQIRKVIGPKERPTKGCTSYCSTSRQAASPASAPPSAEVMRYILFVSTPISAMICRSWEMARIAVPVKVRVMNRYTATMPTSAARKDSSRA